jgi:hypothetical protein
VTPIKGGHSTCWPNQWAHSFSFWFNLVQNVKSRERAVLCLLVEQLCQNSISLLDKQTRLIQNIAPVCAELKYSFQLLLMAKCGCGTVRSATAGFSLGHFQIEHPAVPKVRGSAFPGFASFITHTHHTPQTLHSHTHTHTTHHNYKQLAHIPHTLTHTTHPTHHTH